MSFGEFLKGYKQNDWYLFSQLSAAMLQDLDPLLEVLQARLILSGLARVSLWMSGGGTSGSLHYDPYDNLNCQLDGSAPPSPVAISHPGTLVPVY
jgi:hypothetical protein